jgi:hypothetical protein
MQTTDSNFDWNTYGGRDYGIDTLPASATTTTTAKQTARAMRIWLENKSKLEAAGFVAGACYAPLYGNGVIVLTLDTAGKGKVSSCKRGGSVRPIIDLHNGKVAASFIAGAALLVTYSAGSITIQQQA